MSVRDIIMKVLFLLLCLLDPNQILLNLTQLVQQPHVFVLHPLVNFEFAHLDGEVLVQAQLPHFGLAEEASDLVLLLAQLGSHF